MDSRWGLLLLAAIGCRSEEAQQAALLETFEDASGAACPGVPVVAWQDSEVSGAVLGLDGHTLYQWGWSVEGFGAGPIDSVFEVLDISDPQDIQRRGRVTVSVEGIYGAVHPLGSLVAVTWLDYSVDDQWRLAMIDVADPDTPVILSTTDLGDELGYVQFTAEGDRMFVAGLDHVEAIDLSDPTAPVLHDWPGDGVRAVAVRDGVLATGDGVELALYELDDTMGPYPALATHPVQDAVEEIEVTPTGFVGRGDDGVVAVDRMGADFSEASLLGALGYIFESGPQGEGMVVAHEAPKDESLGLAWVDAAGQPEIAVRYIPENVDFFTPQGGGDLVWTGAFRDSPGGYFGGLLAVDLSPCD